VTLAQLPVNRLMRAGVRSAAGRFVLRSLRDIRDLELFDRAMTLAAQAFTSILPILIIAATAFARALERCFRRIWKTPKAPIRFAWRWVAAIVAIVIGFVLVVVTRYVVRGTGPMPVLEFIIETAIWCGLWWVASWIVINRTVSLRALLPGSLLAGLGFAVATVLGRVYLPRVLASSADQFGVLGVAFS